MQALYKADCSFHPTKEYEDPMSLFYHVTYGFIAQTSDQRHKEWREAERYPGTDIENALRSFAYLQQHCPNQQGVFANFLDVRLIQEPGNLLVKTIDAYLYDDNEMNQMLEKYAHHDPFPGKVRGVGPTPEGAYVAYVKNTDTGAIEILGTAYTAKGAATLMGNFKLPTVIAPCIFHMEYREFIERQKVEKQ